MKAMILSAGFGTRLIPHTRHIPKPLFPMGQKPVLEILIEKLMRAGCHEIMINTHHLAEQIDFFLTQKHFGIPVHTFYEPVILGTGGAIKHVEKFWGNNPLMVINSDIVTDIDLKGVYDFHQNHRYPATLVLTDSDVLNTVSTDPNGFITGFYLPENSKSQHHSNRYTFTGIQILDKEVLHYIPDDSFFNIIDAYLLMMEKGHKIKAFFALKNYWKDIGTEKRYREAVLDRIIPEAFFNAFSQYPSGPVQITHLKGDGSNRNWFRLKSGTKSLIMADHGIHSSKNNTEAAAFVKIGQHLFNHKVPVPQIYHENKFSGHVILQDLGDTLLQSVVINHQDTTDTRILYEKIIKALCHMWMEASKGFDTSWTCQTTHYNRHLILEHECRYFTRAFLQDHSALNVRFEDLAEDCFYLADQIEKYSLNGFMHRDFQSRNIMIKGSNVYFIDFQGGRIGPLQYDLASLLIDPYTALSETLQAKLLAFCLHQIRSLIPVATEQFIKGFQYCAIARNLQILGAFAYLSQVQKKTWFRQYIPHAIGTLKHHLDIYFEKNEFKILKEVVKNC